MGLTLNQLTNDIYVSADLVGRELVGYIPSVTMNSSDSRAAIGDTIKSAITADATAAGITESMTVPDNDDYTINNSTMSLNQQRAVRIPIEGEQTRTLQNNGTYSSTYGNAITQAMRALANECESFLHTTVKTGAGFAFGDGALFTSGSLADMADTRRVLVDHGCPTDDISAVIDTLSGARLRTSANLVNTNQAGSDSIQRQGILLPIFGVNVRESNGITAHTNGTRNANYDTDLGGTQAIGTKSFNIDTGTGTIKAGDVVQFASDTTRKYVVSTDSSGGADSTLALNAGVKTTIADGIDLAFTDVASPSHMFHRNAVELVMRAPAMPDGGDGADDVVTVTDPHSGLVFQVAIYRGYHKSLIEVSCVYGAKVWKPEFVCAMLGGA
jgi:hypothetical protein